MADQISSAVAANIYKSVQQGAGAGIESQGSDKGVFSDLVQKAATESIQTMREGEKASADAIVGKANLTDVVDAITNAELTLQTVIAVRDKMLDAYQEILRMPI